MKDVAKIMNAVKQHVSYRHHKQDPFEVLIFTVLSQRTRDENTMRASNQLFKVYDTPKKLAGADLKSIEKLIKPSGFYRVKAKYIKAISKELVKRFDSKVPSNLDDLLSLPGVGRKTANCTLVYGFSIPAIPVDTHCHRIPNRIGLVKTKTPEQSEFALMKIIPKKYWIEFNDLVVKFGQTVCLPINPKCNICKVAPHCDYYKNVFFEEIYFLIIILFMPGVTSQSLCLPFFPVITMASLSFSSLIIFVTLSIGMFSLIPMSSVVTMSDLNTYLSTFCSSLLNLWL